ncbi:hypothetical protein L6452_15473 [Arctium lappa]|uniref:Uncharacterized protein n=1 Tax=Arctium lappa TaxID=4217 RepID=A0ACB9CNT8_ARCLA|nr:hypothetical protein L6452_15473 [Arctium lappa]
MEMSYSFLVAKSWNQSNSSRIFTIVTSISSTQISHIKSNGKSDTYIKGRRRKVTASIVKSKSQLLLPNPIPNM